MKNHRIFLVLLPFFALIFSIGCASLSLQKPEEALRNRVEGLMQAQIHGRWDVAYGFYDSSFRKTISQESFAHRPRKLTPKDFAIEDVMILSSGNEATVKVKIDISFMGYDFKGAPQKQHWIKGRGQWFLKVKPGKNPFAPKEK